MLIMPSLTLISWKLRSNWTLFYPICGMFCCLKVRWENLITFCEARLSWHKVSILSSVGHSRTSPTAHHRMCAPSSDSCQQSKNKPSWGIQPKRLQTERKKHQTNKSKQQPKAKVPESILSRPTCSTVLANAMLRHQNIHSREQHWCRTKRLYQPILSGVCG